MLRIAEFVKRMERTKKLAETTIRQYEWHLRELQDWMQDKTQHDGKELTLEELTFDKFLDYAYQERERPDGEEYVWSGNTAYLAMASIRKYLKWLHKDKKFKDHPVFEDNITREETEDLRHLEEWEVEAVKAALKTEKPWRKQTYTATDYQTLVMILVALHSGVRCKELISMRISGVDFEQRLIKIKRAKKRKNGRESWVLFPLNIHPYVQDWIEKVRPIWTNGSDALWVGIAGNTPGEPMTTSGFRAKCRSVSGRAGIDLFGPHALRRTWATKAAENMDFQTFMHCGGWDDPRVAMRYVRKSLVKKGLDTAPEF